MWTPIGGTWTRGLSLTAIALGAACSKPASQVGAAVQQSTIAATPGCGRDSLHPSAVPPAPGMWTTAALSEEARVSAMIGPAEVGAGSTLVTRTIETVESASDASAIRTRLEDAVMRVQLVPRYLGERRGSRTRTGDAGVQEPAAVYTLTPLVSVISYEACAGPAAVRYLRRDAHGYIDRDVMLHRTGNLE